MNSAKRLSWSETGEEGDWQHFCYFSTFMRQWYSTAASFFIRIIHLKSEIFFFSCRCGVDGWNIFFFLFCGGKVFFSLSATGKENSLFSITFKIFSNSSFYFHFHFYLQSPENYIFTWNLPKFILFIFLQKMETERVRPENWKNVNGGNK